MKLTKTRLSYTGETPRHLKQRPDGFNHSRCKSEWIYDQYKVEYVVIGGIAAVLQGVPRATFDLNILIIDASEENAQELLNALLQAKLGTAALISVHELLANEIQGSNVQCCVETGLDCVEESRRAKN